MTGLWILLLLILISALPVISCLIWFRRSKTPVSLPWLLYSLLGGGIALLVAGLLQSFFPPLNSPTMRTVLFKLFIQIALTEETGRLLVLLLLCALRPHLTKPAPLSPEALGAITGLLTGLGFAVIETATYGAIDTNLTIALVRSLTAALIHGACGSRVGIAAFCLKDAPARSLLRFASAAAIHGIYNFMVANPGFPAFFPILLALAALLSSIQSIRTGKSAIYRIRP